MFSNQTASKLKTYIVVLSALSLLVASCKKSSPDKPKPPENTQKQNQVRGTTNSGTVETAPSDTQMVPLPIKLPKPMFVGTPQNIRVPNLEKPLGKPRPPFLAPAGAENVALRKPVISSDPEPIIGEIAMVTDGDREATDGSYVELGPFLQSVTIDLAAIHDIYAILLWHYHKQARVYFDVVVQVADDPDFITNVRTLFNNDIDNS
ncbi:MAG: hypothetical protein ACYS76_10640, partial [Planctomycetota bacterium]